MAGSGNGRRDFRRLVLLSGGRRHLRRRIRPQANPDGTYGVHEHSFTIAKHDAEGHWTTCDQCGEATEKLPHTFEWVVDKKPSATVDGSKHEQCSACGFAKDPVSIPATGGTVDPEQGGEGSDQGGPSANDQDASSAEQGKKGPGLAKTDDASQGANRVLRIARLCVCGGNPLCASCCHEVREVAKPLSQSAIRQVGSPGSPGLPVYYAWDSGTTPGSPKHYVRRIRALRPENPCQRVGARSEARAASIVGDEALLPQTGILPVRRC